MAIFLVLLKVMITWSAAAIVTGFSLGAAIRRGDRLRKDAFLSCVYAYLESMQTSRG